MTKNIDNGKLSRVACFLNCHKKKRTPRILLFKGPLCIICFHRLHSPVEFRAMGPNIIYVLFTMHWPNDFAKYLNYFDKSLTVKN